MHRDSPWQPSRLGELLTIQHGWPFRSVCFHEELTGRPIVVNIGNFRYTGGFRFDSTTVKEYRGDYPSEYDLQPGDILLVMTCQTSGGEILGIPACVPNDGRVYLHNQRMGKVVLSAPDRADPRFLYWLFLSPDFNRHLFTTASGSKILHTSPGRIEAYRFPLPPLPEQHAIAAILGSLDDKIECNRRMNRTLEAIARAVFKSWFVDFDPVRARADGRTPTGMDAATAALFPDHFTDSDLGKIPAGWRGCQWGDLVRLEYGRSLRGYEDSVGSYPVYGTNGLIGHHGEPLCQHPGIIVGRKGAYRGVHYSSKPFYVIDTAFYVEPTVPLQLRWAYYEMLQLDINGMDTGSAIPSTSRADFYALRVAAPPHQLQMRFVEILTPCWERQQANDQQSRTLAALRDTLLPKLISGELRVPAAERLVEDVA